MTDASPPEQQAAGNPPGDPESVLRAYFAVTDPSKSATLAATFFDESAVMELPFRPPPAPRRYEGLAVIRGILEMSTKVYRRLNVTDVEIYRTTNPLVVFAYWNVDHELVNGNRYANRFLGHFEFTPDGRILHVREYYDPAMAAALFADNPDIYNEGLWASMPARSSR